ncbi:MAG: response regulator transcription factor [Oscillospiraceae bacterium]|jgi:DNA-binding response OmpR family regulator|nr:response regulator transcription factor [Oscillospiraceae bacterium]
MASRILIVEDEEKIARFLELELSHEGYEAVKAADGREGLELALEGGFAVILLDVMLPGLNGLEVIRRLRKSSDVPVLMLTARDAVMDKVSGLDMGADDYVTKPFAIEELLARIRVLIRKKESSETAENRKTLVWGALTLDSAGHTVRYGEDIIDLTKREFALLELMLLNKNIVLSRETFIERVWGYDYMGETNVVDVYVRYLRGKIDEVYGVSMIRTVRGVGYVVKDDKG